jgi:chorismate mutase
MSGADAGIGCRPDWLTAVRNTDVRDFEKSTATVAIDTRPMSRTPLAIEAKNQPPEGTTMTPNVPRELLELRASIDNLDAALIHILAERFRCTKAVGVIKAKEGLPAADPDRELSQVKRLRSLASLSGLDPDFAEKFLAFTIEEVIRHHQTTGAR